MNKKILIALDVLIAAGIIAFVVFWTVSKATSESEQNRLSIITQQISQAKLADSEKANRISTPDEIDRLKKEISNMEKENNDNQKKMKQVVYQYFDIVYNTEGDFVENKDKIMNAAAPIVTDSFKKYKLEKKFTVTKYSDFNLIAKTEKKPDLCTMDDIFIKVAKNENDDNIYSAFCIVKFDYETEYRHIGLDEVDGSFLISADEEIYTKRYNSGGVS